MGILELLTIVFIVLKLIGTIDWSWWLVLLPTIVSVSFYILWFVFVGSMVRRTNKAVLKEFEKDDFFKKW
jgi:ABC-type bacteriocin/lantibiotic exporter with double-glycine peptidase domain